MSGDYQQAVVERIMADYESMSRAGKSEAFLEAARPTVEMWAKAVLDVLDLRECCAICGLAEADCTGWDHSEYEHDYGPLIIVGADFGSTYQHLPSRWRPSQEEPAEDCMTITPSAAAASSQFCAAQARSSGTLAGLLSVGPGAEADSRYFALPVVRRSSMTRRALKALARVNAAVIGTSPSPADMSGMSRPGHHQ